MMTPYHRFSVVIPTLNEAVWIEQTIRRTKALQPQIQIIIADGGSTDGTQHLARAAGVKIVESKRSRGLQCNMGASLASGEILLFLHADTFLPEQAFSLLSDYFEDPSVLIGTFRLAFDENNWWLRFYCSFTRFDSIFTRFGDQCIAVRNSFFKELGGFPEWPLFEDVHFLRAARKKVKIVSFPASVVTSARRFVKTGVIRTQLINGWMMLQYLLGVSPEKLASHYAVD